MCVCVCVDKYPLSHGSKGIQTNVKVTEKHSETLLIFFFLLACLVSSSLVF